MVQDLNDIQDTVLQEKLAKVISGFSTGGVFLSGKRIGSGHINDSFLIATSGEERYILQRINHSVFQDVPGLMKNILKVTGHIGQKITGGHPLTGSLKSIRLIPARNHEFFLHDPGGNYWRLYNYIEGSRTYDRVKNTQQAYEGGKAFALFQCLTADIPAEDLIETIPYFHHIEKRLENFRRTVSQDPENRVRAVTREIGFMEERAEDMKKILQLGREQKIPLRVTHNDTKFNNILFDEADRAIAVIDLDTVMPGYILYDFGDAIRTGCNSANEDEADLDKVGIDLELFGAYSRGYISIARNFLNGCEIDHLAFSARVMTFIIGLRFLTDYIDGDHYYRISFRYHNLIRAQSQIKLLESMETQSDRMNQIIKEIVKKEVT